VKKRPWIIKSGGELLTQKNARKQVVSDLIQWHKRHSLIFVHGGGPQIEHILKKNRIPVKFVHGRRVTTPQAMILVEQVLSGLVNKSLAADLNRNSVIAIGISCRDGNLIVGTPLPGCGRAAKPKKINIKPLTFLIQNNILAVVSSVASDAKGHAVNINADEAASALAVALKAERLIFLTNTNGVLDKEKKTIKILKLKNIPHLIEQEIISGGMIPKVQSAQAAIKNGVTEVDIVNGFKGIQFEHGTRIMR